MKQIFIFFFLSFSFTLGAQEICDDAIDNDGDGLIDLNDTEDCICETEIPSSLIPNPSFEEYIDCPTGEAQLENAQDWIQASEATSDFIHTCGNFLGNMYANNARAPLPFPDGDGCIGFRDGNTNSRPNFKEYVGSALTAPMIAGTTYKLDFFVGFHNHPSSLVFPMAVFFTDRAQNLPFGGGDSNFGCPSNDPSWDLAVELIVEGRNEWVNVQMEFTPTKNYEAIVLGPGCDINPLWRDEPYFFMDRLALAELSKFVVPANIIGNICNDQLTIELKPNQLSYQWYYEGVALVGETGQSLDLTGSSPEGDYLAVVETIDGCFFSDTYELFFPSQEFVMNMELCEGEKVTFAGEEYSDTGEYRDTVSIGLLCDSISILNLVVNEDTEEYFTESICPGDEIVINAISYTEGGEYEDKIPNHLGCDSTLYVDIIALPGVEQYSVVDSIAIGLGEMIDIVPSFGADVTRVEWYDGNELISEETNLLEYMPLSNTTYIVRAYNDSGCVRERSIQVEVDKTINIYIPDVFTPLDATNNKLIIGTNAAVVDIADFRIYDRWGSIVFTYSGPATEFPGWDGRLRNGKVEQGLYTYVGEFLILDESLSKRAGDILIIR